MLSQQGELGGYYEKNIRINVGGCHCLSGLW